MEEQPSREELILQYFRNGYTARQITSFLLLRHGISLSVRHVRRLLHGFGARAYGQEVNVDDIEAAIREELNGSGRLLGYRLMWRRLNFQHGLRVTQLTTRLLLGILDPEGVALRSRHRLIRRQYVCRGPNDVWHIDGYDKLKQFGFGVHGAIDGFSRKVLWLQVGMSNNNPKYIAGFYLKIVKMLQGVPTLVRADRGTENSMLRDLQIALRMDHADGLSGFRSFRYGRSTANQRIECFWSQLRRMTLHYWINFFKDIRDRGLFDNSNGVHIECLRFCFSRLIQAELDKAVVLWNNHTIRRQRNAECPSGIPSLMYEIPETFGSEDKLQPLLFDEYEFNEVEDRHCQQYPQYCDQFVDILEEVVGGDMTDFAMPTTADEALSLYTTILDILDE